MVTEIRIPWWVKPTYEISYSGVNGCQMGHIRYSWVADGVKYGWGNSCMIPDPTFDQLFERGFSDPINGGWRELLRQRAPQDKEPASVFTTTRLLDEDELLDPALFDRSTYEHLIPLEDS